MSEGQAKRRILVERTAGEATALASKLFKTIVCEAVAEHGSCSVALAGGTTPHALYLSLASLATDAELPWGKVEIFFGDERDVPLDHVESNYRMAQRTLLDNVPIPPSRVHPMRADAEDLAGGAAEYEATIRRIVKTGDDGIPRFDLVLLGMGADGHTASLFPQTQAVNEREKLITANAVPVLGRSRITMTFPLMNAARNALMLVTGDDKAEAIAKLVSEEPQPVDDLPAAGVAPTNGVLFVVLDAPAGWRAGLRPG